VQCESRREEKFLMTERKVEEKKSLNYLINVAVNCLTLGFTMREKFLKFSSFISSFNTLKRKFIIFVVAFCMLSLVFGIFGVV
jgi:hypothetical protein